MYIQVLERPIRGPGRRSVAGAEPRYRGWTKLVGTNGNGHILVVDDEREICDLVQEYLSGEGYRVSTAHDGAGMRRVMAQSPVDLVTLDLMLPGEDGLTLARWLRENFSVGIIMLTGRGEMVDHILGLEMGADYYVPKPYHQRQLLAAVRSVLRRITTQTTEKQIPSRSKARFAGWTLDVSSRELVSPSGRKARLTTGEFDLLAAFVNKPNQVLSRDQLAGPFNRTSHREQTSRSRIDIQVARLRSKLENDPKNPTMIKTLRSSGYIFTPEVEWL
jgi:two-component system, OmpR family, response regulator